MFTSKYILCLGSQHLLKKLWKYIQEVSCTEKLYEPVRTSRSKFSKLTNWELLSTTSDIILVFPAWPTDEAFKKGYMLLDQKEQYCCRRSYWWRKNFSVIIFFLSMCIPKGLISPLFCLGSFDGTSKWPSSVILNSILSIIWHKQIIVML